MHRPRAIVVDIDGTVALKGDRSPYDMTTVINDEPNVPVINIVDAFYRAGYLIVHMSGRYESAREDTFSWLKTHTSYHTEALYMRPDGSKIKDSILKQSLYETFIEPIFDVQLVIDDRNQVVDMWRNTLNLPCFQVVNRIEGNF